VVDVALGTAALVYAVLSVSALPTEALAQVVIGIAITMLAGMFQCVSALEKFFRCGEISFSCCC